jgi:two-component system LytT family response regulator
VIFITAFDNFAVQAFRFSAVDYLLKPLSPNEFQDAIKKALESESASNQQLELLTLLHNLSPRSNYDKRIVLRTSDDIHLVNTSDLVRIESDGSYSRFILKSGKRITVSQHLKHYDEILANHGFFRCHQSHMVNISYINRYHKAEGGMLILIDGSSIPVSSRKRENVINLIEQQGIH